MGLTVKTVARRIRRGQRGRWLDRDGLYLEVRSATNASWVQRYELRRRERWYGLGSTRDFTLPEARQRSRRARQLLADGIDPLEARRAERAKQAAFDARNKSFAMVTREYFDAHAAG